MGISIDGTKCDNLTHEQVVGLLKSTGLVVRLEIGPSTEQTDHLSNYLEKQKKLQQTSMINQNRFESTVGGRQGSPNDTAGSPKSSNSGKALLTQQPSNSKLKVIELIRGS